MPIALCQQAMTCVYRLYDAADALLYVGIAYDFDARFKQHAAEKDWWPQVARKDITWHDNRNDALHEEARAIDCERPRHNERSGAHPVGLAIIDRKPPKPYAAPRLWSYRVPERNLELSKFRKGRILEEVELCGSHAGVALEGELVGVVIPMDWYLEALAKLGGSPNLDDLPRVDPTVFWAAGDPTES